MEVSTVVTESHQLSGGTLQPDLRCCLREAAEISALLAGCPDHGLHTVPAHQFLLYRALAGPVDLEPYGLFAKVRELFTTC